MKRLIKISSLIACLAAASTSYSMDRCYGLYIGDRPASQDIAKKASLYGASPCLIMLFYDNTWTPTYDQLTVIGDAGAVPVITVEPWNAATREAGEPSAEYIALLAKTLNGYGRPVYIRYGHEMNGDWYPWSGDPQRYVAAYRSFHDELSRKLMNKEVQWIFSVNNDDIPNTAANHAGLYFPGDDYVDIIGLDGYLNEPSWLQKLYIKYRGPFQFMFGQQMRRLEGHCKPFMITETGVASSDDDFKTDVVKDIVQGPIPEVIWFDVNKEADWRLTTGIKTLEFFRKLLKQQTGGKK